MSEERPAVRLRRLHVTQYRSLKDTVFEPNDGLSVLVGPNGVGKTNLLHSLLLLRGNVRPSYYFRERQAELMAKISLESQYAVNQSQIQLLSEVTTVPGERGLEEITSADENWSGTDASGENWSLSWPAGMVRALLDPERSSVIFHSSQISRSAERHSQDQAEKLRDAERLRPIIEFNSGLRYYSAAHFTDPSKCPSSFEVEGDDELIDEYSSRGPHRAFVYRLFRAWKRDRAAYERFIEVVGKGGIGLVSDVRWKTYALSSSEVKVRQGGKVLRRKRRRTLVIPMVKVRQSWVAFNQLSDGTFKSLALAFHLLTDDWSMLLLEEPEVCVHHGLLTSIVELIKARSIRHQIVVSTHSELVVDMLATEQVFPVSITASGTKVKRLDLSLVPRELKALKAYLQSSGNLGEYWKHGGFRA